MSNALASRRDASSCSPKTAAYQLSPSETLKRITVSASLRKTSSDSSQFFSQDALHVQSIEEWRISTSPPARMSLDSSSCSSEGYVSAVSSHSALHSPGNGQDDNSYDGQPPRSPRSRVSWGYCPWRPRIETPREFETDECEWTHYSSHYFADSSDTETYAEEQGSVDSVVSSSVSALRSSIATLDADVVDVNIPGMQTFDEMVGNLFLTHQARRAAAAQLDVRS